MQKLFRLIEFETTDLSGEPVTRIYELYSGKWYQCAIHSANPYWYNKEVWEAEYALKYTPSRVASILVLSDGGLIGYWNLEKDVRTFIVEYMRGKIVETV